MNHSHVSRTIATLFPAADASPEEYRARLAANARMRTESPEQFQELVEEVRQEIAAEGWSRPRRHSSIAALLVGDVKALLAKHRAGLR